MQWSNTHLKASQRSNCLLCFVDVPWVFNLSIIVLSIIALKLDFPTFHLNTSSKKHLLRVELQPGNFDNLEYRIQHWQCCASTLTHCCDSTLQTITHCAAANSANDSDVPMCKLNVVTLNMMSFLAPTASHKAEARQLGSFLPLSCHWVLMWARAGCVSLFVSPTRNWRHVKHVL